MTDEKKHFIAVESRSIIEELLNLKNICVTKMRVLMRLAYILCNVFEPFLKSWWYILVA